MSLSRLCVCPTKAYVLGIHCSKYICSGVLTTLTSLLCPHSHFLTKLSHSILVCCSHRYVVGRVSNQTKDAIVSCHSGGINDWLKEGVTHIIRREYPSILHLVSGKAVVIG